jgi:NlpC/P60 family putative phage cell wall peptidase
MSPESVELREVIVSEARSWVGTPYHHLGDIKSVGVDCAMLLVRIYQTAGIIEKTFDPRPYEPEWYLHRSEPLYLIGMQRWGHRIEADKVQPGDIAMFNFGKHAAHGAIVVDDNLMIHAYRRHGNVEYCERRAHADRLDSYWSVFL